MGPHDGQRSPAHHGGRMTAWTEGALLRECLAVVLEDDEE